MENITLGTFASNVIWLGAFIGGCLLLLKYAKSLFVKFITEPITKQMMSNKKEIDEKIDELKEDLNKKINLLGEDQCKNYLVRYLADVEDGEKVSEVETERAYDAYEKYTNTYHGNSYIHSRWNKVMKRKWGEKNE